MNPNLKKKLFFDMLRIRLIEEAIAERYHEQEMRCSVHLCTSQEAIAVGVCANLRNEDYDQMNVKIETETETEIEEAFSFAKTSPFPEALELYSDLYA